MGGNFRINLYRFQDKTRVGKSTENVRKSTDNLSDAQNKILNFVEKTGRITNKDVQTLLQVKDSRALKVLKSLVVAGLLVKKGKLRGSYYILNDEI